MAAVPVQSKLGCHFRCVYCTYRKIEGSSYRLFERESVAEAIRSLSASGVRNIEFVDNVFNSPYEHALTLCEDLARLRHGACLYSLELNPLHTDDKLLTLMERAGFRGVGITVESASGAVLERLRKGYSAESVYNAATVVKRHKLPCVWIFMLGGPGETEATIEETLRFAAKSIRPWDTAFFNMGVRIYPGTELESIARNDGVLNLQGDDMLTAVLYLTSRPRLPILMEEAARSSASQWRFAAQPSRWRTT